MEDIATQQPKRSKIFDSIDEIDRYFYGRKMKNFIQGSILVLVVAPLLDELLEVPYDRLTFLATLTFFLYTVVIVLAWLSAWRDDNGNWTWSCAKDRLLTYYETFRDTATTTKTNSRDENLYKLGWWLFFGAICWKGLQNISVFVRKPLEKLTHGYFTRARHFEKTTNHWYWVAMLAGVGIMYYLYRSNPQILQRIKNDLRQLFGRSQSNFSGDMMKIRVVDEDKLVVNSRREEHMQVLASNNTSNLFSDFVSAIKNWSPGKCNYEYEFQNKLYRHLKKSLPGADIELEYPIGDAAHGNKGRADIVINDTILVEMKRDSSAGAVQRAKGQILQYSDIWRNRGPVILLLCDHDYSHAKLSYTSTMVDLNKLERPVMTIVAEN
jgi:hypothetical protein